MFLLEVIKQRITEVRHVLHCHLRQYMPHRAHQHNDLLVHTQRMILLLAEDAHQTLPIVQLFLRAVIQIAGELRKNFHLAVLRQVQAQAAGRFLRRLRLRRAANGEDESQCE